MDDFAREYHSILSREIPEFIRPYLELDCLKRLGGIGLLCGTDWTPLFNNRFWYSRYDHSLGTALLTWNFTRDKAQTIASLLHDISTPAFSHVTDFKNGDALTQSSTEDLNQKMIDGDRNLELLLLRDGLSREQVNDYHKYPVCDNSMPGLSADRLEYMYPSGAALAGIWNLEQIRENYGHIILSQNEKGIPELGFDDEEAALTYMKKFIDISMILQRNEDKVAMQLMADILTQAESEGFVKPGDYYRLSEKEFISHLEECSASRPGCSFSRLFNAYRTMTKIKRSPVPIKGCWCVSLKVKRRYVDPLANGKRISCISTEARQYIEKFLSFEDEAYGCVEVE